MLIALILGKATRKRLTRDAKEDKGYSNITGSRLVSAAQLKTRTGLGHKRYLRLISCTDEATETEREPREKKRSSSQLKRCE